MLLNPAKTCSKVCGFCLTLLTSTVVTAFLAVDTACQLSYRVYTVLLPDHKSRKNILSDDGFHVRKESMSSSSCKSALQERNQHEFQAPSPRKSKSWDSRFVNLTELKGAAQPQTDGELDILVSHRSTISSSSTLVQTAQQVQHISSSSSVSSGQHSTSSSKEKPSALSYIQNTLSFCSRASEGEETRRYIEELQNQVSQLMKQSSLIKLLQQRVEELENQRDLLTKELLDQPKDRIPQETLSCSSKNADITVSRKSVTDEAQPIVCDLVCNSSDQVEFAVHQGTNFEVTSNVDVA